MSFFDVILCLDQRSIRLIKWSFKRTLNNTARTLIANVV